MTYEYTLTKHPVPKAGNTGELDAPDGWELGGARLEERALVCLWVRKKKGARRPTKMLRALTKGT